MSERFKVATIEVWPNSGGQGASISVYAATGKEYGMSTIWLSVDIENNAGLSSLVAERLAEALKRAAGIARGTIERGAAMVC